MVNEIIDIPVSHVLDVDLKTLPNRSPPSRSSDLTIDHKQQLQQLGEREEQSVGHRNLSLTAFLNSENKFLINSGPDLNWKFLEQVDSLDNQLRSDEPNAILTNGCHLMASSPAASDHHSITDLHRVGGMQHQTVVHQPADARPLRRL